MAYSKSMIEEILINKYNDCMLTLKGCSEDDAKKEYLCDSEEPAYNFDEIVKKLCQQHKISRIKSVDSLLIKGGKVYLIEFKNQIGRNLKWDDIRLKIHESILILQEEFAIDSKEYQRIEVLVVYAPNSKEQKFLGDIREHWKSLTKKPDEIQRFDMFKRFYDINCLKFGNSDFKKYIGV